MGVFNPAGLDTTQPAIKVPRLTELQASEMAHRLSVTEETPDIVDWGWLDGRTLYIVDTPEAIAAAIGDRHSDIRNCLDIAEDNPDGIGFILSMRSLVRKAEQALAAHERSTT